VLADLRQLRAAIDSVLSAAEKLAPAVVAWQAAGRSPAPQEPAAAPEPPAAANGSAEAGEPPADAPAASEGATCPECGASFTPVRHGGQQQRFCTARCRGAAHQRRRRARVAAAEPPEPADPVPDQDQDLAPLPDVITRPLRGECKVEDPRAAILAQAARLPWENGSEAAP
jgi:hypothetical protein